MKLRFPYWNIITKYKFNSIFFKYFKFIVLTTIFPFVILNIFVYTSNYNAEKSAIENELTYNLSSCASTLERTFSEITKMTSQISGNAFCKALMYADLKTEDAYIINKNSTKFNEIAGNYITGNSFISKIYLYCPNSGYVHSTYNSNYLSNFSDWEWYEKYETAKKSMPDRQAYVFETSFDGKAYITVCRNISTNPKYTGIMVIQLYKDELYKVFKNYKIKNASTAFYFLDSQTEELIAEFSEQALDEKNITCITEKVANSEIDFRMATDINIRKYSFEKIFKNTVPYILFTIFFTFAVAYLVSVKFYTSLAEIIATLESDSVDSPKAQTDELSYINMSILNAIAYTKKLEHEFALNLSALERSQAAALQAQINPHFLFNTLNLVNTTIYGEAGRVTESMKIINLLSELYGELIDNNSYLTGVEEELGYAKKYLKIELIKNDYMFDIEWNIDENVKKYNTLKMILQPIIENAIFHGIKELPDETRGRLKINAYVKNNILFFEICDNGPGMEKETLDKLKESLATKKEIRAKHIGLVNINSRIKLIYGNDFGVFVESDKSGTKVTVKLPLIS